MPTFNASEVATWCGTDWFPQAPDCIAGFCHDTRRLTPNSLYIAIRGDRLDGHDFVEDALAKGASGTLIEDRSGFAQPCLKVPSTLAALADCARGYRGTWQIPVVGVTGSAGKTTVRSLIAAMLEATGTVGQTHANWNNAIGLPMSMLACEASSVGAVYEAGTNHPGEIAALASILSPDLAVLTNVGPAHIGNFGSIDAIRDEKFALLRAVPASGLIVLPADERAHLSDCRAQRVTTAGLTPDADFVAGTDGCPEGEVWVTERSTGRHWNLPLYAPGAHSVTNTALAVACVAALGLSEAQMRDGLRAFQVPSMRGSVVSRGGVRVVNDAYNANPLSMSAALRAFSEDGTSGRRWLLLGGMLELGAFAEQAHRDLGTGLVEGPWSGIVCVGEEGGWIRDAYLAAGGGPDAFWLQDSAEDAGRLLASRLCEGDSLLLKGSRGYQLEKAIALLPE